MTAVADPEVEPETDPLERVDHLVCGWCWPDYVPGRQVVALCGAPSPDSEGCFCSQESGCHLRCVDPETCSLCVLVVKLEGGCPIHGW